MQLRRSNVLLLAIASSSALAACADPAAPAAVEGLSVAEEATLTASDVGLFDQAGYSVAIDAAGDRVAVGIVYDSNGFLYDAGSVHVFEHGRNVE